MYPLPCLEAIYIKKSLAGPGTDEKVLIQILCTKTNSEMIELKNAYKLSKLLYFFVIQISNFYNLF